MTIEIYDRYYRLNNAHNRVDRVSNGRERNATYDLNALATVIASSVDREGQTYLEHRDIQIDSTMSCSRHEAIGWTDCWMLEAIFGGNGTHDPQLRAKFLAAYDLRNELKKGVA